MPYLTTKLSVESNLTTTKDWTEYPIPTNAVPYYATAVILEVRGSTAGQDNVKNKSILLGRGNSDGHISSIMELSVLPSSETVTRSDTIMIPLSYGENEQGEEFVKFEYRVPRAFSNGLDINIIGYASACLGD